MDNQLYDQLGMSTVSLAKVGDVDEMKREATKLVTNINTDVVVRDRVEEILGDLEKREDYQLTPGYVQEVDDTINNFGKTTVTANGTIRVDGTEAFGFTLSPAEWRRDRVDKLKNLLTETYRNIKRWANQLEESFSERWNELVTTIEVLENRLDGVEELLDNVKQLRDECRTVKLPGVLVKAVTREKERVSSDLVKSIIKDINYFSSVMKFVNAEQVRSRNSIIRYFGNPKLKDISIVKMELPRILDVRVKPSTEEQGKYVIAESRPLLEGYRILGRAIDPTYIKTSYTPGEDNTTLVNMLVECGFDLVRGPSREREPESIKTLSLTQIFELCACVKDVIGYVRGINDEWNPANMDPVEIKDNLATLKANEEEHDRADQYAALCTDYQFRLDMFRTQVSGYMTILASHLITLASINLECYDA